MARMSMSVSHGRAAGHAHDVEREYREGLANVDPARTRYNAVLVDVPLAEVYRDEFGAALADYNAAQAARGHPERRIPDYLAHIRGGKQEKTAYELVVQLGNRETNSAADETNRVVSSQVYRDWLAAFEREFPQFRVHQAAVHQDEATPHLHVAYVPVSTGNKRGLSVRNSLRGALRQMGYQDVRAANARMFELLEECAARYGIERADMGCSRARLDVRDYKAMAADIAGEDAYPYRNDPRLVALVREQQATIDELLGMAEEQEVSIRSLVEYRPSISTLGRLREKVAAARAAMEELSPRLAACRAAAGRCRAAVDAVPVLWRDHVINPISDRLRRQRDDLLAAAEEENARRGDAEPLASRAARARGRAGGLHRL